VDILTEIAQRNQQRHQGGFPRREIKASSVSLESCLSQAGGQVSQEGTLATPSTSSIGVC
jgi:hypothetical protein